MQFVYPPKAAGSEISFNFYNCVFLPPATSYIHLTFIMKKLVAFTILLVPFALMAQSKKVKLYAYQQDVRPGMRNITIDESGSTKEVPNKKMANYFIYVEVPAGKEMRPQHMWINGSLYDVKAEEAKSPVIMTSPNYPSRKADTLVRGTTNQLLQLTLVPTTSTFKASNTAKKKMKSNQFVLHTIEKGKNCYYYLDRIKILEPVALQ